jgi:hypothetical protein
MKNILILILVIFTLTACKKNYNCNCTSGRRGVVFTSENYSYHENKELIALEKCFKDFEASGNAVGNINCKIE